MSGAGVQDGKEPWVFVEHDITPSMGFSDMRFTSYHLLSKPHNEPSGEQALASRDHPEAPVLHSLPSEQKPPAGKRSRPRTPAGSRGGRRIHGKSNSAPATPSWAAKAIAGRSKDYSLYLVHLRGYFDIAAHRFLPLPTSSQSSSVLPGQTA